MKTIKSALAIVASFAISLTSITSAQSAELPLTYTQFIESQGYKDLEAASQLNTSKLSSANGVVINLEITSAATGTITGSIKATKTAVTSVMALGNESVSISYFGGSYYVGLAEASSQLKAKNSSAIKKRLPSSSVKMIKLSSAPSDGSSFLDLNPSSIFTGESTSSFLDEMLNLDTSGYSFSEVTASPNALDATATDYRTEMNMSDSQTGIDLNVVTTQTFNSEGLMTLTKIEQEFSLLGMTVSSVTKLTQEIDNNLALVAPAASTYMTSAKFVNLDKQISAELALKTNATKIVTKAKSIAKSSKKSLTASHLTSAAKSLKIKAKSIPNGTKLTGTYKGVSGSLCVTTYKGVATIKNC